MDERIQDLVARYLRDELTQSESLELQQWIHSAKENKEAFENATNLDQLRAGLQVEFENERRFLEKLKAEIAEAEKPLPAEVFEIQPKKRLFPRIVAAASIVLAISTASYFIFFNQQKTNTSPAPVAQNNDVLPGTYNAKLTLDDGSTIVLNKNANGEITKQGNATVSNQAGQLIYSSSNTGSAKVLYNTLSTGRGETYPTVLSDGSKVWLNNETSIRYPVTFTGKERRIELNGGEAYFEVAHNASMPFKVIINGAEVEVLGTHFSVSAFPNEATTTNLLTGKVKVTSPGNKVQILNPGERASVGNDGKIIFSKDADVEGSIAWVHGYFHFEDEDVVPALSQLARWYNVEIVANGKITGEKIKGEFERNIPLSKVLSHLERIGNVKLSIEGRKIIVANR